LESQIVAEGAGPLSGELTVGTSRGELLGVVLRERWFVIGLWIAAAVAAVTYQHPAIAKWVGFALAGYSVIANDSIQTIGTFLSSNFKQRWWVLWLFLGGLFMITTVHSWVAYGGDVTYGRLSAKGFETAPETFTFLQVTAPLFLLVLTRMKMPVSTTFMMLSGFATSSASIGSVVLKSVSGYVVAFAVAIVMWTLFRRPFDWLDRGKAHPGWRMAQWLTSGWLWCVWLMQDAANVAVYLPRNLSLAEMLGFSLLIVAGLGLLMYHRGGRIQHIITEKTNVMDVRPATFIDLTYATILYIFKVISRIPMSTTWVFIGLLGGRELALVWGGRERHGGAYRRAGGIIRRDLRNVTIGLVVSLVLAVLINPVVRNGLFG